MKNRILSLLPLFLVVFLTMKTAAASPPQLFIVLPRIPSAIEQQAASELSQHLQMVTGVQPDILSEPSVPEHSSVIYVGHTAFAMKYGFSEKSLGHEEWCIRELDKDHTILTGGGQRGILYSVYEYLERRHGILWIDEHTTLVPGKNCQWTPPEGLVNLRRTPAFILRQIYDTLDSHPASGKFKERNKGFSNTQTANGMTKIIGGHRPHHTFVDYSHDWPSDKPELFSRGADGRVLKATSGLGPGQICMTTPEARALVLQRLRQFIKEDRQAAEKAGYPPPLIYDISQNDNDNQCTCPSCRALAEKEGSYSAPLLDFINTIAREIRKEYPDILIRTFAYSYSADPPKSMKAEDNVIVHLAMLGCEMGGKYYTYDTMRTIRHPLNAANRQCIAQWAEHARHLAWWSYWTLYPCGPDATIHVRALQQDMSYAEEKGVYQIFMEYENPVWGYFFPLTRFLGYKLMDNPKADIPALTKRFMDGYYGKGAATMTRLMNFYEAEQERFPKRIGEINVTMRDYLTDDYFQRALQLLDQAEKECRGDTAAVTHIRRERAPLIGALLMRWPRLKHPEIYDHSKLVEEFNAISTETIRIHFPEERFASSRKALEGQLKEHLKRIEANAFTGGLPAALSVEKTEGREREYIVFNARHFGQTAQGVLRQDPEAYTGLAMTWATSEEAPVMQLHNWMVNKKMAAVQLDEKTLPRDGKYHWINLRNLTFEDNARVQLFVSVPSALCIGFYRYLPPGSLCDVNISLKWSEGKIWSDRVILRPRP